MTLKVLLSEEHPHSLVKRIIVFLFLPSILYAAGSWEGKVVGVSDGDAIKVLQDGKQVKIRLVSIDCPEKGQPSSRAAKTSFQIWLPERSSRCSLQIQTAMAG